MNRKRTNTNICFTVSLGDDVYALIPYRVKHSQAKATNCFITDENFARRIFSPISIFCITLIEHLH